MKAWLLILVGSLAVQTLPAVDCAMADAGAPHDSGTHQQHNDGNGEDCCGESPQSDDEACPEEAACMTSSPAGSCLPPPAETERQWSLAGPQSLSACRIIVRSLTPPYRPPIS